MMPKPAGARRALFFDRDGVLNVDSGYVWQPTKFVWRPTAVESVKWLNDRDILVFVVTNQSGVARGYFGEADVRRLHEHMQAALREAGAHIDDFRYCPHHPQAAVAAYRADCACRKPRSGMITDLLRDWELRAQDCRLIGDKPTDIEAGQNAGVRSALASENAVLIDLVRAAMST